MEKIDQIISILEDIKSKEQADYSHAIRFAIIEGIDNAVNGHRGRLDRVDMDRMSEERQREESVRQRINLLSQQTQEVKQQTKYVFYGLLVAIASPIITLIVQNNFTSIINLFPKLHMISFFSLENPFLYVAIVWAIFFGWKCLDMFDMSDGRLQNQRSLHWSRKIMERWFNGLGAFLGWVFVYYLFYADLSQLKIEHLAAVLIAFLGVTGNLPFVAKFGWFKAH